MEFLSYYKETLCDVKNKYSNSPGKKAKTKMVLTDENYFCLYPYKMIARGKIDFLSVENGNKIVVTSIIIIFNLIKFNITIDNKYLPSDNVFDISFYRKTIIDNMQLKNANESGFSNVYDRYITNVINLEKMTLLGEIIIFVIVMVDGKLLLMLKSKKKNK